MRLTPGQRFGAYDIVREIGRGSMAVVYEATQRSLDRRVALKVLHGPMNASPEAMKRFEREAEAAARLEHPNIVSVIDRGVEDGHHYIAMTLVHGDPLDSLVRRKRAKLLSADFRTSRDHVDWAVRLAIGILRGLDFAHGKGVVHRDVKPQNVFVEKSGVPKVGDFGIARIDYGPSITVSGEYLGTPRYSSPEALNNRLGRVDNRCDVYSAGVTLWEMLVLSTPYEENDSTAVARRIETEDAPRLRRENAAFPRDLGTILEKAMHHDADSRYPSAAAFANDLERFLAGEPIVARPLGPVGRGLRYVRRRKAAFAAVLLGVTVLGFAALKFQASWIEGRVDAGIEECRSLMRTWRHKEAVRLFPQVKEIDPSDPGVIELERELNALVSVAFEIHGGTPDALMWMVRVHSRPDRLEFLRELGLLREFRQDPTVLVPEGDYCVVVCVTDDEFGETWFEASVAAGNDPRVMRVLETRDIVMREGLVLVRGGRIALDAPNMDLPEEVEIADVYMKLDVATRDECADWLPSRPKTSNSRASTDNNASANFYLAGRILENRGLRLPMVSELAAALLAKPEPQWIAQIRQPYVIVMTFTKGNPLAIAEYRSRTTLGSADGKRSSPRFAASSVLANQFSCAIRGFRSARPPR